MCELGVSLKEFVKIVRGILSNFCISHIQCTIIGIGVYDIDG